MQYSPHQMRTICSGASSTIREALWFMTARANPRRAIAQLLLGACVLLVPPVLMVAGVMYEGAAPKDAGQQVEAEHTDKRPELAASFAVASAKQHPVISEPSSVAEGPAAPAASSTQKHISTRYKGPMTIGDGSEQSPTVEVENPQTAAVADLSSKEEQLLAERSPARSATPHFPDAVAAVEEAQPASPPGTNVWKLGGSAFGTEDRGGGPVGVPHGAGEIFRTCRLSDANSQEGSGQARRVLCGASRPAPPR